ncbi:hypothetical protein BDV37DRAFT_254490 [Aspergillus pseudonomiae]|uniref:Uncharacterized protein n=1 Tax=Aspergillus pseudonomiae TaxID=1506151 RepID=A0A5N7D5P6_9EURO|nr:uncharacterized protein BDV37DRAFT_254490 [Aspergillus pseudonomiae]KAE8401654.1 hypothetical protein BDV37DRAFT_254490 [Aspergillus pseudonomiae]
MKLLTCAWSPQRSLRSKDWQLVVLRTASLLDAPYEWDVNEPVARVFGYTDAHLAGLRSGDLSSTELFSDRQRLISAVVEDLCLRNRVNQDTVLKAKQVLGDEALMDLFYTQAIYAFLARTMNSCLIDFDAPIPGLEDMLRQYNAAIIERESASSRIPYVYPLVHIHMGKSSMSWDGCDRKSSLSSVPKYIGRLVANRKHDFSYSVKAEVNTDDQNLQDGGESGEPP